MPANIFLETPIPLPSNAVKSLIFRSSALLVQLTVTKLFSLIAYHNEAFTSYLIFSEPLPQQLLYILRGRSILVLSFLAFITIGGLWDTMLWGLDHPGIIPRSRLVDADIFAKHRGQDSPYGVTSRSTPGNIGAINLVSDLSAGLFDSVNLTLAGVVAPGYPSIAENQRWKYLDDDASFTKGSLFPGARIYLDDEGWSVSVDILKEAVQSGSCPVNYASVADVSWDCEFNNFEDPRRALDYLTSPLAVPAIWWTAIQGLVDNEILRTDRGTNPWEILGKGGDTVLMKMVFSVSRGNKKHTFMVSAMKTTLLALAETKIDMNDVRDLVRRTWRGGDSSELMEQDLASIGDVAQKEDIGLVIGRQHSDGYKVTSRVYQLVSPFDGNSTVFTAFQILDANLTLINSETVDTPPTPFGDCDTWYRNEAYGGVVSATNCFDAVRVPGRTSLFQGEADTMAVFLLQGTLGKKRATTAADALNDVAWQWIQDHDAELESLVLSRAYILAGNPKSVKLKVTTLVPALSVLQLILVLLPLVAFAVSWGVVFGWVGWHYQASLFSNLITTTHDGYETEKPDYMTEPPNMGIVRVDGIVYLGTDTGVFLHTGRDGGEAPRAQKRAEDV